MIINLMASVCENSNSLSVIYLAKTVFELITSIIVPILLIIMIAIDFVKIVFSGKDENIKKVTKSTVTKVIAGCAVYFIPTIMGLFFELMDMSANTLLTCYENANADYITVKRAEEEAARVIELQEIADEQQAAKDEREALEKARETARIENAKDAEEKAKEAQAVIGEADTSNQVSGNISTGSIAYINTSDLAVPLYYSDHKSILTKLGFNSSLSTQAHNILYNISTYVKANSSIIPRFETAGAYVSKAGYHGKGLAIDLFNNWSLTYNGKTYYPYASQGNWSAYNTFICEVCSGSENCKYNITYIIYEKYFKGNGWCWGGNWGKSYFDPMHYEYTGSACSTSNKASISC